MYNVRICLWNVYCNIYRIYFIRLRIRSLSASAFNSSERKNLWHHFQSCLSTMTFYSQTPTHCWEQRKCLAFVRLTQRFWPLLCAVVQTAERHSRRTRLKRDKLTGRATHKARFSSLASSSYRWLTEHWCDQGNKIVNILRVILIIQHSILTAERKNTD